MSQQSRFSDFLGGRGYSEILHDGGAEKRNVFAVPPGVSAFFTIGGGTGCTGQYFLFSGISASAIDGETKFWATVPPCDPESLGVVSSACRDLAVSSAELRGGVEFRLTISNDFGVGFTAVEISGCPKKDFSSE